MGEFGIFHTAQRGVVRPKRFVTLCCACVLLSIAPGCGNAGDSPTLSGLVLKAAPSRDSRELIKWSDARRLLGGPVGPPVLANPDAIPDLPGCPAYARLARDFYQRIDYISDKGVLMSELVTERGGDTQNLENLRSCSKEQADGAVIDIQVHRIPGGPGNVEGLFIIDGDWKLNLRARVVDGANVMIITDATARTADEAIAVAVARWGGTPLPNGYDQ